MKIEGGMKKAGLLTTSAFLAFVGTAQAMDVMDNDNATYGTLDALSNACVSYREKDVNNCVGTVIQMTNNVASTLKHDISEIPVSKIDFACLDNFQNINTAIKQGRYVGNTPLYVLEGFLAARFCLEAVERETKERNISFLPGARGLLHEMIDNAEQGKLVFRPQI